MTTEEQIKAQQEQIKLLVAIIDILRGQIDPRHTMIYLDSFMAELKGRIKQFEKQSNYSKES